MKQVTLSAHTLNNWIENALPEFDLFFFAVEHEEMMAKLRPNCLVMPKGEFFDNASLTDLNTHNSYRFWQLSNSTSFVCVTHPEVIGNLPAKERMAIFKVQKELNRGLIFDWEMVRQVTKKVEQKEATGKLLEAYLFSYHAKQFVAMQTSLWNQLDMEWKRQFLSEIAEGYVDDVSIPANMLQVFQQAYPHISPLFNTFSKTNGANCFAAVCAAISAEQAHIEWISSHWVHANSLLYCLHSNGYTETFSFTGEQLVARDIIVWKNEAGVPIHASFYLGNGYFFNKDGQNYFTPWQLVPLETLLHSWGEKGIVIFRKL